VSISSTGGSYPVTGAFEVKHPQVKLLEPVREEHSMEDRRGASGFCRHANACDGVEIASG
jgi:hypothetical protein